MHPKIMPPLPLPLLAALALFLQMQVGLAQQPKPQPDQPAKKSPKADPKTPQAPEVSPPNNPPASQPKKDKAHRQKDQSQSENQPQETLSKPPTNPLKPYLGRFQLAQRKASKRAGEIQLLIKKLGSQNWSTRESARQALLKIGDEALPFLTTPQNDRDIERSFRIKEIFEAIRWSYPKILEQKLGQQFRDYSTLNQQTKTAMFQVLRRLPPEDLSQGASFITKIIRFDKVVANKIIASSLYLRAAPTSKPELDLPVLDTLIKYAHLEKACYHAAVLAFRNEKFDLTKAATNHLVKNVGPSSTHYDQYLQLHISVLIKRQNYQAARPFLTKQIQRQPKNLKAYIQLAEVNFELGATKQANATLKSVEEVLEKNGKALDYLSLTQAYRRFHKLEKAYSACQKGLIKKPFNHELNTQLALIDIELGRTKKGLFRLLHEFKDTEKDSASDQKISSALLDFFARQKVEILTKNRGILEDLRRGRPVEASHNQLARWLLDRGLDELAIPELKFILVFRPKNLEILLNLAKANERLGKPHLAIQYYQAMLKISPKLQIPKERLKALQNQQFKESPKVAKKASSLPFWEQLRERPTASDFLPAIHGPLSCSPFIHGARLYDVNVSESKFVCLNLQSGRTLWASNWTLPKKLQGLIQTTQNHNKPTPNNKPNNAKNPEKLKLSQFACETLAISIAPSLLMLKEDPIKALEPKPLIVVIQIFWQRGLDDETFAHAKFMGFYCSLYEPSQGKLLQQFQLTKAPRPISPLAGSGTQYYYMAAKSTKRKKLCFLDLSQRQVVRSLTIRARNNDTLHVIDNACMVQTRGALTTWTPQLAAKIASQDLNISRPIDTKQGIFLTANNSLLKINAQLQTEILANNLPVRHDAGLGYSANIILCADRDGKITAIDAKNKQAQWTLQLDKAALRKFYFAKGLAFIVNGIEDRFPDEIPYFIAVDLKTGQLVWKRPVELPIQITLSDKSLVLKSGAGLSNSSVKLTVLMLDKKRPQRSIASIASIALELKSTASDAFAGHSFEVSVLLFRLYLDQLKANKQSPSIEDLVLFGRMLAKSRRPLIALNVLATAEQRAGEKAARRFHDIRTQLQLITEPWPEHKENKEGEQRR